MPPRLDQARAAARRSQRLQSILEEDIDRGRARHGRRAVGSPPADDAPLRILARRCSPRSPGRGCGNKDDRTFAETEGLYVDVGAAQLPGADLALPEPGRHRGQGVPPRPARGHAPQPAGDEVWFGVFMRVKNYTDAPQTPADDFEIEDTEGNKFDRRSRWTRRSTRSPTGRSRSAPRRCLPEPGHAPAIRPDPGRADALQAQDRRRSRTARSSCTSPSARATHREAIVDLDV